MNTPLHTSRQRIVQLVNELRDRRRLVWLAPLAFSFLFLYALFELKIPEFCRPFVYHDLSL